MLSVSHLTDSGPCMTLVISKGDTGEGAVESFRDLLGPTLVEEAKEQNPERLATLHIIISFCVTTWFLCLVHMQLT